MIINRNIFIYALIDPRDCQVRYIGETDNLNRRFDKHLKDKTNSHKVNWIQSLLKQNIKPELYILDTVSEDSFAFWERHYISLYKSFGFKLTNITDGGETEYGWHHTKESCNKISLSLQGNKRGKMKTRVCTNCKHEFSIAAITQFHNEKCTAYEIECLNPDCLKLIYVSIANKVYTKVYCNKTCHINHQSILLKGKEPNNKGKKYKQKNPSKQKRGICITCGNEYAIGILNRWHGDKCTALDKQCEHPDCNNIFHLNSNNRKTIYCSKSCASSHRLMKRYNLKVA